jgi:hypothetical protein
MTRFSVPRAVLMLLFGIALLAAHGYADADTPAGTVAYTTGVVSVQPATGNKHFVVAGSTVATGDTIQTAKGAEAVLLMADHQRIYLKGDTLFRIDNYHFSADDPKQNVSFISLLRGGLRVISGLIGKQGNPDAYRLTTQTSTIGIRGTEWSVFDCELAIECTDGQTGENIRVYHGTIDIRTEIDHRELSEGFGTVIHSRRGTIATMPGPRVQPVTPSPAACK